MKKIIYILIAMALTSCMNSAEKQAQKEKAKLDSTIAAIERQEEIEQKVKQSIHDAIFDTVGLSESPVKVYEYGLIKQNYSSYRNIYLRYKNVSDKIVSGVRFKWYGENVFGEAADMGGYPEGFGGGYMDNTLRPGKKDYGEWSILSRDAKKVILAWPYEVVFEDGSKWELRKN